MNTWEENRIMLSQIITSFLEESEITNKNSIHKIQNIFKTKLGHYYKKRFDYDMQELNKMFLEDIFNDINNLENNQPTQNVKIQQQYNETQPNISQPIQQPPQNIFEKSKETSLFDDIPDSSNQNSTNISNNYKDKYVYTAEEIRAKKQLESQNMFDEKKREFEKYQNNFRPENIDFSDKQSGDNEKIDDVLKRVMETRQYDLQIPETEIKKAESWINNGREVETSIKQTETNSDKLKNLTKKTFINNLKNKLKKTDIDKTKITSVSENKNEDQNNNITIAINKNQENNNGEVLYSEVNEIIELKTVIKSEFKIIKSEITIIKNLLETLLQNNK